MIGEQLIKDDLDELKMIFIDEVSQVVADSEKYFLSIESDPHNEEILEQIFRVAHNLKGSARGVGFNELGEFMHELESFLIKIKNKSVDINRNVIDLLLKCNDHIVFFVESLKKDLSCHVDSTNILSQINNFQQTPTINLQSPVIENFAPEDSSNEISFSKDQKMETGFFEIDPSVKEEEKLFVQDHNISRDAEDVNKGDYHSVDDLKYRVDEPRLATDPSFEMDPIVQVDKSVADASTLVLEEEDLKQISKPSSPVKKNEASKIDESIRVSLERLDKLINFAGELVILESVLKEKTQKINDLILKKHLHHLRKICKEIQDQSMSLRMVSVRPTFQKIERIVRDVSRTLSKDVVIKFQGENTEFDKTVLENISDPLVHLVRNAVDHGIEMPEERKGVGKSGQGVISLNSFHRGGKLIIEVQDDGKGIDGELLKRKAIEKNIIHKDSAISENEAINLIFHPGFSTKSEITEVSGRGVGMDVVKTNIEKMQGKVHVRTKKGAGTTFEIVLPLTLAVIDGLVVRVSSDRYVIPISHVYESLKIKHSDIHQSTSIGEVLLLRGETIPLFKIENYLYKSKKEPKDGIAIVIRTQKDPFAVFVDDIVSQSQIVIKKLGYEFKNISEYSGSAILGDGYPALILELPEMITKMKSRSIR